MTYFQLIEKVGDRGLYQWIIYIILVLLTFSAGTSFSSLAFLFLQPGFDCSAFSVAEINCQKFICSKFNAEDRKSYLVPQQTNTLTTEFGFDECEGVYTIGFFKSLLLLAMAISPIMVNCCISYTSKKLIFRIFVTIQIIGSVLLVISSSIA